MALEIFWSKRADNKFDKILDYLNSKWGERVTSAFVKKVYDFLDILVEFPEIGTLENTRRNIRGFVVELVYLDTESLWQRNSYTQTLCATLKHNFR